MTPGDAIGFLLPYEFSPTVLLVCGAAAWLYLRVGHAPPPRQGRIRALCFWLGLLLMYGMLQTQYDFYAQHMFFLHRLQHLVLHHLAPLLIVLALPQDRLLAGLPAVMKTHLIEPISRSGPLHALFTAIQQPLLAAVLFVGLIYFWLTPGIHFIAMLNIPLYNAMNWGMALDGLLFWWMVFHMRREGSSAAHHYGGRILLLFLVMVPQVILGAAIAFHEQELFEVYAVCGRAWPLSAQMDQQIGGLVTGLPAAMMSIAGALVLMARYLRELNQSEAGVVPCRDPV